jgi:predicted  nucleic acid-binding Zn-ribbon protein
MILEDFNALSDEEKTNYLKSIETDQKKIEDLTAERDSFKTENDSLRSQVEQTNKELKATKELNFTMARKINVGSHEDPETTLYNFMKGYNQNGY